MNHLLSLLLLLFSVDFSIHVESEQEFLSRLKSITDARLLGPESIQDRSLIGTSLDKIGSIKSARINYSPPSGVKQELLADCQKILKELDTYQLVSFEHDNQISHPTCQYITLFLEDGRSAYITISGGRAFTITTVSPNDSWSHFFLRKLEKEGL